MSFLIIVLLAIVQGVTEFLPISSSGHLLLFYKIFNIESGTLFVSILLHVATFFSIIVYYRKELWEYLKNFKSKTTIKFIITTLATIIIVLLFKKFLIGAYSGSILIWCFIITSIMLFVAEQISSCHKYTNILTKTNNNMTNSFTFSFNSINYLKAGVIGIVQGFAVLPGISRSGSTIATALILGVDKKESADYSFIISLPIVVASLVFEIAEFVKTPEVIPFSVFEMVVGFIIAFVVGYLSIKLLLKLIKKQRLTFFSFYLLFLCIAMLIFEL